jgi:hypothetical protein
MSHEHVASLAIGAYLLLVVVVFALERREW